MCASPAGTFAAGQRLAFTDWLEHHTLFEAESLGNSAGNALASAHQIRHVLAPNAHRNHGPSIANAPQHEVPPARSPICIASERPPALPTGACSAAFFCLSVYPFLAFRAATSQLPDAKPGTRGVSCRMEAPRHFVAFRVPTHNATNRLRCPPVAAFGGPP